MKTYTQSFEGFWEKRRVFAQTPDGFYDVEGGRRTIAETNQAIKEGKETLDAIAQQTGEQLQYNQDQMLTQPSQVPVQIAYEATGNAMPQNTWSPETQAGFTLDVVRGKAAELLNISAYNVKDLADKLGNHPLNTMKRSAAEIVIYMAQQAGITDQQIDGLSSFKFGLDEGTAQVLVGKILQIGTGNPYIGLIMSFLGVAPGSTMVQGMSMSAAMKVSEFLGTNNYTGLSFQERFDADAGGFLDAGAPESGAQQRVNAFVNFYKNDYAAAQSAIFSGWENATDFVFGLPRHQAAKEALTIAFDETIPYQQREAKLQELHNILTEELSADYKAFAVQYEQPINGIPFSEVYNGESSDDTLGFKNQDIKDARATPAFQQALQRIESGQYNQQVLAQNTDYAGRVASLHQLEDSLKIAHWYANPTYTMQNEMVSSGTDSQQIERKGIRSVPLAEYQNLLKMAGPQPQETYSKEGLTKVSQPKNAGPGFHGNIAEAEAMVTSSELAGVPMTIWEALKKQTPDGKMSSAEYIDRSFKEQGIDMSEADWAEAWSQEPTRHENGAELGSLFNMSRASNSGEKEKILKSGDPVLELKTITKQVAYPDGSIAQVPVTILLREGCMNPIICAYMNIDVTQKVNIPGQPPQYIQRKIAQTPTFWDETAHIESQFNLFNFALSLWNPKEDPEQPNKPEEPIKAAPPQPVDPGNPGGPSQPGQPGGPVIPVEPPAPGVPGAPTPTPPGSNPLPPNYTPPTPPVEVPVTPVPPTVPVAPVAPPVTPPSTPLPPTNAPPAIPAPVAQTPSNVSVSPAPAVPNGVGNVNVAPAVPSAPPVVVTPPPATGFDAVFPGQ